MRSTSSCVNWLKTAAAHLARLTISSRYAIRSSLRVATLSAILLSSFQTPGDCAPARDELRASGQVPARPRMSEHTHPRRLAYDDLSATRGSVTHLTQSSDR